MAGLQRAGLHRIQHLQPRDKLARRKDLDAEAPLGQLPDPGGDPLRRPEQHIEIAREGGGEAPAHLRVAGLGEGGCGKGGRRGGRRGAEHEAAVHRGSSEAWVRAVARVAGV